MWKIVVGFVVFAAVAMFLLSRAGDVNISGEQHGIEVVPAASAASNP